MEAITAADEGVLRELAEVRPEGAKVLSFYLDLDPTEFATAAARSSAVRSLVAQASRDVESAQLGHAEHQALRADLERAREFLETGDYAQGARAVALFLCQPIGLFRPVRLQRPVQTAVHLDDRPRLEPLRKETAAPQWAVLLVNRSDARLLRGTPDDLRELGRLHDDVRGQHQQGGWSQARYERSVDKDVDEHLDRVAANLLAEHRRRPVHRLLLGGPDEIFGDAQSSLSAELVAALAGTITADVGHSTPEEVLEAARPVMADYDDRRIAAQLDRLRQGSAHERAALGLELVLAALNEQRVETLLLDEGFSAPGAECPACGLLAHGGERCAVDQTPLEHREDVVEAMVRRAVEQSAEIVRLQDRDDLAPFRGVAAVLRF